VDSSEDEEEHRPQASSRRDVAPSADPPFGCFDERWEEFFKRWDKEHPGAL
jgi:hypothetical protein